MEEQVPLGSLFGGGGAGEREDATNSLTALSHPGGYSGAARDVSTFPPVVVQGSLQCTVTKGEACSRSSTEAGALINNK